MAFISQTEDRAQMQSIIPDDGSVLADFDEVFDASVGFAFDEGLSISRMLNNEGYEQRRDAAKIIFDNGEDRTKYSDRRGKMNYDALSAKFPETIKTDATLAEEKNQLLSKRRDYYNDVVRRSDSTAGELLGSMNAFMLDPLNVATMAIGTPFAIAKGVGVVGKAIKGALGAAAINAGTEALIQPIVLDYKLDIDSPYGMEDAIANIAMAAGGGLVLGGATGGISGWLKKIRGEVDKIDRIPDDIDPIELDIAVKQIDDAIELLKSNPEKADIPTGKTIFHGTDKTFDDFDVKETADGTVWFTDNRSLIEKGEVGASGKGRIIERIIKEEELKLGGWKESDKYSTDELISQGYDGLKLKDGDETTYQIFNPEKLGRADKAAESANTKQIESDANYLRALEEERTRINRTPEAQEKVKPQEITDQDLEGVFNAMDKPNVVVDGDFVDAKKLVKQFDDDIDALESMRICIIG